MTQQQSGELSKNRAAYFDMLADLGMTKHLGSLAVTGTSSRGAASMRTALCWTSDAGLG